MVKYNRSPATRISAINDEGKTGKSGNAGLMESTLYLQLVIFGRWLHFFSNACGHVSVMVCIIH